jgi:hypothetical protein
MLRTTVDEVLKTQCCIINNMMNVEMRQTQINIVELSLINIFSLSS